MIPHTDGGGISRARWLSELRDSKLLSAARREKLDIIIRERSVWGIGVVSAQVIDQINILRASHLAMRRAVGALEVTPDAVIVDGREQPGCSEHEEAVIGADAICMSVAAASIVAKVHRDAIMDRLADQFPGYGLARHKGYATAEHFDALSRLGYSSVHRLSFAPVRAALGKTGRS
jgi:ribonuclease HII